MSDENSVLLTRSDVDVIRQGYEAFNAGDMDAVLALHTRDAEHDWSRSIGPYAGVYVGHAAIRRFFKTFLEAVEELRFDIEEMVTTGPHVLVMVRASIRGRGSGASVVARGPHVWTLENGQIARFQLFQDKSDALEAVGLRQGDSGPVG
jgi:ketosteroid isomerase-like protein